MVEPLALERIHRVGEDPPSSFVTRDGRASETSIVTVIRSRATRDPEFRRLVARNDRNGNGIPDKNLRQVYDALMESSSRDRAVQYLARDYRSTRVVYSVESDAATDDIVADGRQIAGRYRGSAIATGQVVVFDAISALILESALTSLAIALGLTIVFLVAIYWVIEGLPSLGIANAVPIVVSVAAIGGSMRLLGVPFNAITATLLAITIGLGVDYSVHVVHRFIDERREQPLTEALDRTVRGTGGALTGSMLTTVSGIGVLVFALLTPLGQFGVITGLSIFTSYLASLLVLPSTLVVWDRLVNAEPDVSMNDLETGTVASEPTD
jgi:predicted RND superfamily exporter protein